MRPVRAKVIFDYPHRGYPFNRRTIQNDLVGFPVTVGSDSFVSYARVVVLAGVARSVAGRGGWAGVVGWPWVRAWRPTGGNGSGRGRRRAAGCGRTPVRGCGSCDG